MSYFKYSKQDKYLPMFKFNSVKTNPNTGISQTVLCNYNFGFEFLKFSLNDIVGTIKSKFC